MSAMLALLGWWMPGRLGGGMVDAWWEVICQSRVC
jgi:hypothetical protein